MSPCHHPGPKGQRKEWMSIPWREEHKEGVSDRRHNLQWRGVANPRWPGRKGVAHPPFSCWGLPNSWSSESESLHLLSLLGRKGGCRSVKQGGVQRGGQRASSHCESLSQLSESHQCYRSITPSWPLSFPDATFFPHLPSNLTLESRL